MSSQERSLSSATGAVLVVDDDDAIQRLLSVVLGDQGFRVTGAKNGVDALARVRQAEPDLIILDLEMPAMDARAFIRATREARSLVPVLVLSAHNSHQAGRD